MIRHVPQHQRTYVTYIVSYIMILANFAIETSLTYTLLISGVPIKHLQKTFGEKSMLDFEQHINLLIDCEQDVIRHSHASLDIDVINRPVVNFTSCGIFSRLTSLILFSLSQKFKGIIVNSGNLNSAASGMTALHLCSYYGHFFPALSLIYFGANLELVESVSNQLFVNGGNVWHQPSPVVIVVVVVVVDLHFYFQRKAILRYIWPWKARDMHNLHLVIFGDLNSCTCWLWKERISTPTIMFGLKLLFLFVILFNYFCLERWIHPHHRLLGIS